MAWYLLSPRAQADLDDIWDYSCERWGDDRAESYVRSIDKGSRPSRMIRAGVVSAAMCGLVISDFRSVPMCCFIV